MSFEIDEKNSSNSMIVKDILNEFPFDKSEIKEDQKESGGIPLSRVIDLEKHEKLLPVLKCKICLNILLNPYDCSKCGNTFCYTCINKLKESMKKCPFGCTDYEIMPSSFAIKKFLEQLNFTCLNKENGCKEIISYNNIDQHDKNCKYINSICPNNQCGIKIQWNLLNNHIQNECLYTLFECPKCHMKINRKEFVPHTKICGIINKEFDKQSPIINKLTNEEVEKNNEIFNNVMKGIENLPFLTNEKNDNINYDNNNLNVFIKSLIFCLSGRISMLENQMNKINNTLQQFSENNLIFYQSINDELENINEKISNLNLNESSAENSKNPKISINKCNNTYNNENFEFGSPTSQNNKEHRKTIFPLTSRNLNEKLLLLNSKNNENQNSTKACERIKVTYQKTLLSTSKNKKKSKYDFSESNSINNTLNGNNEMKEKNKNKISKKGVTITTLKTKEKFIKGMKSTEYIEKLKGIQPKKNNPIISNYNTDDKMSNDNINNTNTNIINDQSNNYLISNNYNTINGPSFLNNNKMNMNKNYTNFHKNSTLKEKIFKEKEKNNDNAFDCIFNNQEIILDKIQNLENVMLNVGNLHKDNSNNEFLSSFNSHKQSFAGINNNSMNIPTESPKSNNHKNKS